MGVSINFLTCDFYMYVFASTMINYAHVTIHRNAIVCQLKLLDTCMSLQSPTQAAANRHLWRSHAAALSTLGTEKSE